MTKNLYIASTEEKSGKTAVVLGLAELVLSNAENPGFFRPIINDGPGAIDDISLISSRFNLQEPVEEMYTFSRAKVGELIAQDRTDEIWGGVIKTYQKLSEKHDFILCEGTDFSGSSAGFEFDINAELADLLGSPVLLVANAHRKSVRETLQSIEMAHTSLADKGCRVVSTVINLATPETRREITKRLKEAGRSRDELIYTIPYDRLLAAPTLQEIADKLGAEVLYGGNLYEEHVYNYVVAAMQLQHVLEYIKFGSLIIVPGDRVDVIITCLAAVNSRTMPYISGILLTGGFKPEGQVRKMIEGFEVIIPILSVAEETFLTAKKLDRISSGISPRDDRKITRALSLFEENVDGAELGGRLIHTEGATISPKMFEYGLLQKARQDKQRIVLPEGEEERILRAAEELISRKTADITLLGERETILAKISQLGLEMKGVEIINPVDSPQFEDYTRTFFELRKHKGITLEGARDDMSDPTYFATMMVYKGNADGMVSGAVHTTGNTIRPALQIIKTRPGFTIVSSVFFMCLQHRVLVYGDCAINTDPDAAQLAEIAISSAATARTFGIEPQVAMLSYSTGKSGKGAEVDKVRQATKIARSMAKEMKLDLQIEGPIQYDAAVDPGVAKTKLPGSKMAGHATVLIFPDLDTGNITYKAVQRSAHALAIGPVLQGLKKPVNDLSRGCTIPDIINTVAITAIQAQAGKEPTG
ncbi:MAG: phosphate acetyltransferase [Candidatus Euphemobacter frigidus]|nr:phosphate acetyltransferase [Candidatus Euphemobacter frigidus]MDP8276754.1 phosphate acetyltransferase [Candidatus Euphemobacter frigidus]